MLPNVRPSDHIRFFAGGLAHLGKSSFFASSTEPSTAYTVTMRSRQERQGPKLASASFVTKVLLFGSAETIRDIRVGYAMLAFSCSFLGSRD